MSEEPAIDPETLRKSHVERLEADLHELASRLTHLHWPSTEAEVTDCRAARNRVSLHSKIEPPLLLGYIVGFSYSVNGKSYAGTLDSPVEVEAGDRFKLRYNPDHPNENNSLCSDNSPSTLYGTAANWVIGILIGFLLLAFLVDRFLKH